MDKKEVILVKDTNVGEIVTFKDLYEEVKEEVRDYEELDKAKGLMEQEVVVEIVDGEGQVIQGNGISLIGWLEGGKVLITSRLQDAYYIKPKEAIKEDTIESLHEELKDLAKRFDKVSDWCQGEHCEKCVLSNTKVDCLYIKEDLCSLMVDICDTLREEE